MTSRICLWGAAVSAHPHLWIDSTIEYGRLKYEFTVPIRIAWRDIVDPTVSSFDMSYFIDFHSDTAQTRYTKGARTVTVHNKTLPLTSEGWGVIRIPAVRANLQ